MIIGAKSLLEIAALVLAILILAGWWLHLEWGRRSGRGRPFRLLVQLFALAALLGLALEPLLWVEQRRGPVILLTPNYDPGDLARMLDSTGSVAELFLMEHAAPPAAAPSVINRPDLHRLRRDAAAPIHVLGDGLTRGEWQMLGTLAARYLPGTRPAGLTQIQWTPHPREGRPLAISGQLSLSDAALSDSVLLYLEDEAGIVDSLPIQGPGTIPFRFNLQPRDTGRVSYRLRLARPEKEGRIDEVLKLHVEPLAPLRILVVESSPSFESRFWKKWAGEQGHLIALRSQISRDRFREEFINRSRLDISLLTPGLLSETDVLVIDAQTLRDFSFTEQRVIAEAVREGLSLLIHADSGFLMDAARGRQSALLPSPLEVEMMPDLEFRLIRPVLRLAVSDTLAPIPAEPFILSHSILTQPLVHDRMERAVALWLPSGSGGIAISLVRDSYRWILQGDASDYAAYWSQVFSRARSRRQQRTEWDVTSQFAFIDQACMLQLASARRPRFALVTAPSGIVDTLYIQDSPLFRDRMVATLWPRETGWHSIRDDLSQARYHFYVYPDDGWESWRRAERQSASRLHAAFYPASGASAPDASVRKLAPISPYWFWSLLLLALTSLWIEQKFRGTP